ncbi:MAG: M48 family metalloprotease [Rubrivivax sp.]|nr:M48 family metalloprotease [Rubrivivax sp.]
MQRGTSTLLVAALAWAPPLHAQGPAAVPGPVRLPALGESASEDLTVGAERRIGDQIMLEGRRDPAYLDDPVLLSYLQSLWAPLVAAARDRGDIGADTGPLFAWEVFLLRDRSVNAFALPGGYVGMHLGMIALATSSDQIASVLAHELVHVTQRHIARSIAPAQRASLLGLAALLLGIIAASRTGNSDFASAGIMAGQGAAIQGQLNFSRDMEREADRIGYGLLASAGFDTGGMGAMFERLDGATRLADNNSFPYLRSHPLTVDRISEARNRSLMDGGSRVAPPQFLHSLMQARARVLMDESAQALQRLNGETSSPEPADQAQALYAGALAASKLNDHDRAERQAAEALALARAAPRREPAAERLLHLLQAQVRLARGDARGAAQALQALDSAPPAGASGIGERAELLLRAQAQVALQRLQPGHDPAALRRSAETLQTWLADVPQDALVWEQLAVATDALGLKLRSMRAAAEARAAVGDLTGAIDRLRAAQAAARGASGQDFIEASVIDARLRQLATQRRQLALEARGRGVPGDEPQ